MSGAAETAENDLVQSETTVEEKKGERKKHNKLPIEGAGSLELNLYKTSKAWKKSISMFFRNPLRSTQSNEGDRPSGSSEQFPDSSISPEQKWQSLGKMFRRQQDAWGKAASPDEQPHKKTLAIKKVFSSYFGKNPKPLPPVEDEK